jgi:hypothetical protein
MAARTLSEALDGIPPFPIGVMKTVPTDTKQIPYEDLDIKAVCVMPDGSEVPLVAEVKKKGDLIEMEAYEIHHPDGSVSLEATITPMPGEKKDDDDDER